MINPGTSYRGLLAAIAVVIVIWNLFSVEEYGELAASAPGQALPGLGVAVAGYLETAAGAFGGPMKLQLAFLDSFLFPCIAGSWGSRRRLGRWRWFGRRFRRCPVQRASRSVLLSLSAGLERPSSEFLLVIISP